jgi:CBS domain-containing protein
LALGSPPARFAWLSIGSQGGKNNCCLLIKTAFGFEDVATDKYRVKDYFLSLGKDLVNASKIGYELCPNGHMASNMLWCKSLTDWIKQYDSWMNTLVKTVII